MTRSAGCDYKIWPNYVRLSLKRTCFSVYILIIVHVKLQDINSTPLDNLWVESLNRTMSL